MKSPLGFDPDEHDYGPASPAIRAMLHAWAQIDWFAPSPVSDAEAIRLFAEHNTRAHRHEPGLFAPSISVGCVHGGWPDFAAWCKRVRDQPTWDWKMSALKQLSSNHSRAHGWKPENEASRVQPRVDHPAALFVRLDDGSAEPTMIWKSAPVDFSMLDRLEETARDSARFYLDWARSDALCAMQWALSESFDAAVEPYRPLVAAPPGAHVNPFVSLIDCYRAGAYPLSLGPETAVLFRFG